MQSKVLKLVVSICALCAIPIVIYLLSDYYSNSDYYVLVSDEKKTYSKDSFHTDYIDYILNGEEGDVSSSSGTKINLSSNGWYSEVEETKASNDKSQFCGNFYIYKGLPWDTEGDCYFYYQKKAKDEIYELFAEAGVIRKATSSIVVNSSRMSTAYASSLPIGSDGSIYIELDGIDCVPIGPTPSVIDRDYFTTYATSKSTTLNSSHLGKIKMAIVVVEKGQDCEDTSNWLYIPASIVDAKAHTWFGGVTQTNVKVINDKTLQISKDWAGTNPAMQYNMTCTKPLDSVELIKEVSDKIVEQRVVKFDMGSWGNNELETYGMSKGFISKMKGYEVVGFVVWGGV